MQAEDNTDQNIQDDMGNQNDEVEMEDAKKQTHEKKRVKLKKWQKKSMKNAVAFLKKMDE